MDRSLFLSALKRRRVWLLGLLCAAGVLLLAFDVLRLDVPLTAWLHAMGPAGAFPLQHAPVVRAMNETVVPGLAWVGALGSLALLWQAWRTRHATRRRVAVFLLVSLAMGPGLLVNGVLKPHWGRPRPAEVSLFGGQRDFSTPLQPRLAGIADRGENGRSFPSGHAAVAFWTTALFFVTRLLLPVLAPWVLTGTLLLGLAAGAARVVSGRHFTSDILWAGLLVFALNALLAWWLLHRHDERQRHMTARPEGKASGAADDPRREA